MIMNDWFGSQEMPNMGVLNPVSRFTISLNFNRLPFRPSFCQTLLFGFHLFDERCGIDDLDAVKMFDVS